MHRYRKNKRRLYFTLLFLLAISIGVGYAYLTSNLKINGTTKISKNTWDIHFEDVKMINNTVSAANPTLTSSNTVVTFSPTLKTPGDEYSFSVNVVNAGSMDAMLSEVVKTGVSTDQAKYVDFSVTYLNGIEINVKDKLGAGDTVPLKVKVRYKEAEAEDLPSSDQDLTLSMTLTYVQADDSAIKVEGSLPVMKSYSDWGNYPYVESDYHSEKYAGKITKIVTKDNISIPNTAIEFWDVSAAGDGSVIAYVEDDGSGNGTYQVTIGGEGGISANPDSTNLFRLEFPATGESSLTSIDLTYLDTTNVRIMDFMFEGCSRLIELDVSKFDKSNVTDMYYMFDRCSSLTKLDISSFDTSKVTNMSYMFGYCRGLTELDLSKFDTSNVTNMRQMFYGCSSLTELDLSGFDMDDTNVDGICHDTSPNLHVLVKSCFEFSKIYWNVDSRNVTTVHNDSCTIPPKPEVS